jgi:hypothetical protein
VDSPDTHELRRLLFETAYQYFANNPFRRDALIAAVQRRGRSLGWWLTEPPDPLPSKNRGVKASAAMIEKAFADLAQRGLLIQVKRGCWSFTVST